MYEITERAGLGRTGIWKLNDWKILTPNILFIRSDRFPSPDLADILLVNKKDKRDFIKPYIIDEGSYFSIDRLIDGSAQEFSGKDNTIPPDMHFTLNFSNTDLEQKHNSIQIVRKGINIDSNADLYLIANAIELSAHPKEFASYIIEIKEKIGYGKPIYAPGLGSPSQLALFIYCGIDLFDTIQAVIYARQGYYLFPEGKIHKDNLIEMQCQCPICSTVKSSGKNLEFDGILSHNYYSMISELKAIRNAIWKGDLRGFVEYRIRSDPNQIALLRYLDINHFDFQEKYVTVTGRDIFASGKESLNRPEIVRFRQRIMQRWKKSPITKILLLLPCSARKPYSDSISHRAFQNAVYNSGNPDIIQEVILTSPLGLVPRELELFYPAKSYDIPVTGHWDYDEQHMLTDLVEWLMKNNDFDWIVMNLPDDLNFVKVALDKLSNRCIDICDPGHRPSENDTIQNLSHCLMDLAKNMDRPYKRKRILDNITSMARFQFGDIGDDLVMGAEFNGRYPYIKLVKNGKQICSYSPDREMFALTPDGAYVFLKANKYLVAIDDFKPHGDIMAVGVLDADPIIRIGDDVVITDKRKSIVIGTGIAKMSQSEMVSSKRGVAVKTRSLC